MSRFQPGEGTAGLACFRPPTYSSLHLEAGSLLVSSSPVQSLLFSPNTSSDCHLLGGQQEEGPAEQERGGRAKRSTAEKGSNTSAPNIDYLLNPSMRATREEYVDFVMTKLKNFFMDRNSTLIYPNLFRLLW